MPCRSDYLAPGADEIEGSKMAYILDELDGKGKVPADRYDKGVHPAIYNQGVGQQRMHEMAQEICSRMRERERGGDLLMRGLSLEVQMWWRDHKKRDEIRQSHERSRAREKKLRREALSKLTREEIRALGLQEEP